MRAARAYLAGIGTSGSLLAGAAALFLVGSAIVAFRGWPQVGAGSAMTYVAAKPVAVTSRSARRLNAALTTARPRTTTVPGAHLGVGAAGETRPGAGAGGTVRRGVAGVSTGASGSGGTPGGPAGTLCATCGGSPSTGAVGHLTGTIGRTVSQLGTAIGGQVSGISGAAGGRLSAAKPQLGNAVSSSGANAGNTATGISNSVGNTISSLGGGH